MSNKEIQQFAKLNESYKVLEQFYLGEDSESCLADNLEEAIHNVIGYDYLHIELKDRASALIEELKEVTDKAMTIANKKANQLIKS